MITPRFMLSQTETSLTVRIRAPYCSLNDLDVSAEENNFIFVCKPYYLRLNLPGDIIDNEKNHSKFDSDVGEFTFTYEKKLAGEEFKDLDFITKFLSPKVSVTEGNRTIEILSADDNETGTTVEVDDEIQYGFAMRGGYKFSTVSSEFCGVFNVDPFKVELSDRKAIRLQDEQKDFSVDHYLCDFIEEGEILEIMHTKCPWADLQLEPVQLKFTDKELDFMKDLTNINYNLTESQKRYCRNGLIEILFAYCYDKRTTFFERTCESSWTINKISSTLCYFDGFDNPTEAVICAFRRSLIYPLYRKFELSVQVLQDLKRVLRLGETFIIKCLIDLYGIFRESDSARYVLNNLFVNDYCTYIMKWDSQKWKETITEVQQLTITKADLQLDLENIEKKLNCADEIALELGKMSIIKESREELDSDDDFPTESSESDSESCVKT